jgi:ectoine hydroxylase-related dioxygenase (phytanoyl-CoA dioxygenase family)
MPEGHILHTKKLTEQQVAQYWRDGYLFPLDLMSRQEAQIWRQKLEQMEQDYREVKMPRTVNTYKRINAQCVMPFAYELASHPDLLDMVEGILGPDILIYGAEFFIKEAGTPHIVSMHQDLTYWGLGATDNLVTAWIALSEVNVKSGCMQFVAGSHNHQILPHEDTFAENNLLSRGQEIQVEVNDSDKTDIVLTPGQISLHHGRTIHGSLPNSSDDRRIGFVIRYVNPKVMQEVAQKDYAMLVRGADRARHFIHYAPPRTLFAPEHLALYEEMREAQKQAMMAGANKQSFLYD